MRAAYPEKHTKRVRRSSAADLFCMRQVSGAGPDGPRRPAAKRDQTHHNPGSPRPPAQRRPSPAPCGRFLLPHAQVQTQKPRLPRVSCSRARWTSVGGNEKPRIPEAKPSGSYSAYGWAERSPRRIPRPWPAPPSGGLRGGGNSFQRFSSSVQPKSL